MHTYDIARYGEGLRWRLAWGNHSHTQRYLWPAASSKDGTVILARHVVQGKSAEQSVED